MGGAQESPGRAQPQVSAAIGTRRFAGAADGEAPPGTLARSPAVGGGVALSHRRDRYCFIISYNPTMPNDISHPPRGKPLVFLD
jgi:hypothetical protein